MALITTPAHTEHSYPVYFAASAETELAALSPIERVRAVAYPYFITSQERRDFEVRLDAFLAFETELCAARLQQALDTLGNL